MPRRREVPERTIIPDSKYDSKLVARFITSIMRDGKKSTAETIVYDAFGIIEEKAKESPLKIFEQKFGRPEEPLWEFDGLSVLPGHARKKVWPESWPANCWMRQTGGAPR
jgi:ribosomal protein S7